MSTKWADPWFSGSEGYHNFVVGKTKMGVLVDYNGQITGKFFGTGSDYSFMGGRNLDTCKAIIEEVYRGWLDDMGLQEKDND